MPEELQDKLNEEQGHDPAHDPGEDVVEPDEDQVDDDAGDDADDQPSDETDGGESDQSKLVSQWEDAVADMRKAARINLEAAQRYANDPNDQNRKAYEKSEAIAQKKQSVLEKMVESDDLDIDPAKALKQLASHSLDVEKQQGETQKQYEKRIERLEQQLAQQSAEMRKSQFDQAHPELAGKYDELAKQAYGKVEHVLSQLDESSPPVAVNMAQEMLSQAFESVLSEAKAQSKSKSNNNGKAKPEKAKPKGTSPVSGSTARPSTDSNKSMFERIWGPEKPAKQNKT